MSRLSVLSGKVVVGKLIRHGYQIVRKKGSHVRLKHCNNPSFRPITVPLHKEIKRGLLMQIIRDVNLTVDEFIEL